MTSRSERRARRPPLGLKWRSSIWYATLVVGVAGATDMIVYTITIPVVPFRLEELGYDHVSTLTGWLLFSFSLGLIVLTPPVSYLSEKYKSRRWPLIGGLVCLIASQVLFMLAPSYWCMVLARVCQGLSSTVVWVVGLAFICDVVPEDRIGQQMGLAMSGMTAGLILAPPVGGAFYARWGFHAPFIFAIIAAAVDLVLRLLVIEPDEAAHWKASLEQVTTVDNVASQPASDPAQVEAGTPEKTEKREDTVLAPEHRDPAVNGVEAQSAASTSEQVANGSPPRLAGLQIVWKLSTSPRAMSAFILSLLYGIVLGGEEPTLPLRLQAVWGLSSAKVGIVYLGATAPSLFSAPIAGYLGDRWGVSWIGTMSLVLSVPWWYPLALHGSLAVFIISLVMQSFFLTSVLAPVTAEIAAATRAIPGMGYADSYGAFNIAYGVGSTIGPIIGGQIYAFFWNGWVIFCIIAGSMIFLGALTAALFMGEKPLLAWLYRRKREEEL